MTRREEVEGIIQGLIRDGVWKKLDFVVLCWLNASVSRVGEEGYEIKMDVLPEEA